MSLHAMASCQIATHHHGELAIWRTGWLIISVGATTPIPISSGRI
jgi:hypothetical protein